MLGIMIIILQTVKVFAITAGVLFAACAVLLTIDLLIEEYKLYQAKWPTTYVESCNQVRSHRAPRNYKPKRAKNETKDILEKFVAILMSDSMVKDDPFTNKYLAEHPSLHRYLKLKETANAHA